MPTYEYACGSCHRRTEAVQRFTDPPLTECPHCGGPLKRVFHPVGIVLKGSGFYSTDNRSGRKTAGSKDGPKDGSTGGSEAASDASKGDAAPSSGSSGSTESGTSSSGKPAGKPGGTGSAGEGAKAAPAPKPSKTSEK